MILLGHLSSRTRSAVEHAGEEARQLGHTRVNDGHLLLGLLHAKRGIAARVLRRHGITLDACRAMLTTSGSPGLDEQVTQLELPAKRALQLALHEAIERNDGPIRASYLLIGTLTVQGNASKLIAAHGTSPGDLIEAAKRKLPPPDLERGVVLLEERLAAIEAQLRASKHREQVARIVAGAADRDAAARNLATTLELTEDQALAVASMPLDMGTQDGIEASEAEVRDLTNRLNSSRHD